MILIITLLYIITYSEMPLAFFVLIYFAILGFFKPLVYAFLLVLADGILQYSTTGELFPRFIHNYYTCAIVFALLQNLKVNISSKSIESAYHAILIIACIRLIDMLTGSPILQILNENSISIVIFSIFVLRSARLIGFVAINALSTKGLSLASLPLFTKPKYVILALAAIIMLFVFNLGVVDEYIRDAISGTYSSGRLETWFGLLTNWKYGTPYSTLQTEGYSNAESFYINQIYSFPFLFPIILCALLVGIKRSYSTPLKKLLVVIVCMIYPYPHYLLLMGLVNETSSK